MPRIFGYVLNNTAYFNVTPPNGNSILVNDQGVVTYLTGPTIDASFGVYCLRLLVAAGYPAIYVGRIENTSIQVGDSVEDWDKYVFVPWVPA